MTLNAIPSVSPVVRPPSVYALGVVGHVRGIPVGLEVEQPPKRVKADGTHPQASPPAPARPAHPDAKSTRKRTAAWDAPFSAS